MISTKSLLLACTTLVAVAPAFAAAPDAPFAAAQARPRDTEAGTKYRNFSEFPICFYRTRGTVLTCFDY